MLELKREIFRLASPEAGRQMMRRRWEHVIKLHDELCMDWVDIGEEIERAPSTAQALYERAWVARQRMAAVCGCCLHKLDRVKTIYRQKKQNTLGNRYTPMGKRIAFIYQGYCPECKTNVWSKPFKPFSFEYADVPVVDVAMEWGKKTFYGHTDSEENDYPDMSSKLTWVAPNGIIS